MWNILRNLSAPALNVADQFARNQIAAGIRRAGLPVLRAARNPNNSNLTRNLAAAQIVSNAPAMQGSAALLGGSIAIGASNKTGLTGQIEGALNQVAPALDRLFSGTPEVIQQFGREQEKKGWGGALEMATPFGFLAAPFIPNTQPASVATTLPRRPIANLPADYKRTELQAGAAAEAFRPGAGFPSQQAAADRAYEAEKSRVAQLTAQDPELKRYADARKLAVAPGATPAQVQAAEDIGMRMWAQAEANKKLARAVKPGQAGYDVIQQTLIGQDAGNAARQGMGYQMQSQMIPTPPPGLGAPQGLPSVNMQPTYGAGGLEVDAEMRKKFQELINQTKE